MEPSAMPPAADALSDYEYMTPLGHSKNSTCGYCGTAGQSFSYYAKATSLSPQFYQTLIDRCWRRSGTLLYRPNQRRSCCPHYTIRLDSTDFRPSRTQRQTLNRFNRFVLGDAYIKEAARLYPRSREEAKARDCEFHLTERIHEAEHSRLNTPPEPAHNLVVTLEEDNFTEEKWRVFDNYQAVVHKDPPENRGRSSFTRFLCSSPLRRHHTVTADGRKRRLGSYHQCYRLDGNLVAVGVLDLLPQCVSSVYFFYHESMHKHVPGKLSALYEISLAVEEGYRWWYPGFYIHSCPKMRYKMDYAPQQVLDPQSLRWDALDDHVLKLLDEKPFVSLELEKQNGQEKVSAMGTSQAREVPDTPEADDDHEDDSEDDSEDEVGGVPLFNTDMPGIPSMSDMAAADLDHIALKVFAEGPLLETSDIKDWEAKSIHTWPGIKAGIAELVAAVGMDLTGSICLDMTRQ